MEQQQFLVDELDKKIDMFRRNSADHKTLHRRLRYGSFGLTAMLSLLSGLALYIPTYAAQLNVAILVFSGTAGILASLEGLRKADELWIHERTIYYSLCDLKRELLFQIKSEALQADRLEEFFNRLQTILNNSAEKWSSGIVQGRQSEKVPAE
ncbi:SLATT domain-containing protein [uncultured Amphritea sp.]|uniref:SLATT domain-containing protein n=1 Tax=uncultured Amphritea sp. TaxID=981605 RepID=UPI002631510C|nr:SLATT domain-containing protein [uncultured Amphritea sp.]